MTIKSAASNSLEATRRGVLAGGFAAVIVGLSLLGQPSMAARALDAAEPGVFLSRLTAQAIEELTDDSVALDEREIRFRGLFRDNFDIPSIGRFVLGRYWRSASEEAQQDFLAVFEDVMVERFAPEFAGYRDTRFLVGAVRGIQEPDQYLVSTTITPPGSEMLQVDWRLRAKDGRFQVLDIIGQGVSMALTLRSEYGAFLKNSGGQLEKLTEMLRKRLSATSSIIETKAAN